MAYLGLPELALTRRSSSRGRRFLAWCFLGSGRRLFWNRSPAIGSTLGTGYELLFLFFLVLIIVGKLLEKAILNCGLRSRCPTLLTRGVACFPFLAAAVF